MMTLQLGINPSHLINLFDAFSVSILLILIAIGLSVMYGFMEVINLAHGGFFVIGGYLTVTVTNSFGSFWLSALVIIVVVGLLGVLMEVVLLRPTYKLGTLTQALVTLGVLIMIQGGMLYVYERSVTLAVPGALAGSIEIFGILYPLYRLFTIVAGTILITITWALLRFTDVGLIVRASLFYREMIEGLGHNIDRLYTLVFVASVILAGLTGMLIVPMQSISPAGGLELMLEAFAIVLIGGLGSYKGTVYAGLIIGSASILVPRYVAPQLSGITIFIILLVVVLIKPYGLYGVKQAAE